MSNYSNTFRISNEQLLLINILNAMYNDNLRQINNITDSLNYLNDANNQIRNTLVHILNYPQTNNSRRNGTSERRSRENVENNNPNRVYLNNRSYTFDSITEHSVPRNMLFSSLRNIGLNSINSGSADATNLEDIFNNFMQPVEVYPTQSQIESATRRVRYCDISRPINSQCPISMDDFNDSDMVIVIRPCGHIFHTEHLMNWFRTNCRCPVCRYDIREYNLNASTQFFNSSNANRSQSERSSLDSSNNSINIERTYTNRIDGIESNANNALYNDMFNDLYFSNVNGFLDSSGNNTDEILGGASIASMLLNVINRTRNAR